MAAIEQSIYDVLCEILAELRAMKKQEFDYWEAWKKAKANEGWERKKIMMVDPKSPVKAYCKRHNKKNCNFFVCNGSVPDWH